ncbi:MAG: hypothetical protein RBT63_00940 [Bdellovibrionales bacterium]|jgi:hypothetical protein|nr:hypothetical protein [Bdellovibrionales bacterium]
MPVFNPNRPKIASIFIQSPEMIDVLANKILSRPIDNKAIRAVGALLAMVSFIIDQRNDLPRNEIVRFYELRSNFSHAFLFGLRFRIPVKHWLDLSIAAHEMMIGYMNTGEKRYERFSEEEDKARQRLSMDFRYKHWMEYEQSMF